VVLTTSAAACSARTGGGAEASTGSDLVSDVQSMTQNADGTFEVTCKDGHTESSVPASEIVANNVCSSTKSSTSCDLMYVSDVCPNGTCSSVAIAKFAQNFDAFPAFGPAVLGSSDLNQMPYYAIAYASPKDGTSRIDGYFDLTIVDNATRHQQVGEAQVSMAGFTASSSPIAAGYLRVDVSPFSYQGTTYNSVEVVCNIWPKQ
jgi:hypothetical protein